MIVTLNDLKQQADNFYISFYQLLSAVPLGSHSAPAHANKSPFPGTFTARTAATYMAQRCSTTKAVFNNSELEFKLDNEQQAMDLLQMYVDSSLVSSAADPPSAASINVAEQPDAPLGFHLKALAIAQDIWNKRLFENTDTANLYYLNLTPNQNSMGADQMKAILARMFSAGSSAISSIHTGNIRAPLNVTKLSGDYHTLEQFLQSEDGQRAWAYRNTLRDSSSALSELLHSQASLAASPEQQQPEHNADTAIQTANTIKSEAPAEKQEATAAPIFGATTGSVAKSASTKPHDHAAKKEHLAQDGFSGYECVSWILSFTSVVNRNQAHLIAIFLARSGFLTPVRRHNSSTAAFDSMDDRFLFLSLGANGKKALGTNVEPEVGKAAAVVPSTSKLSKGNSAESIVGDLLRVTALTGPNATLDSPRTNAKLSMARRNTEILAATDSNATRLKDILSDNGELLELFATFMKKQISEENILFYLDATRFYKQHRLSILRGNEQNVAKIKEDIEYMFNEYIRPSAPRELNIDSKMQKRLKQRYELAKKTGSNGIFGEGGNALEPNLPGETYSSSTALRYDFFIVLQKFVFKMMAEESIPKFCKWDEYINYEESARKAELKAAREQDSLLNKFKRLFGGKNETTNSGKRLSIGGTSPISVKHASTK